MPTWCLAGSTMPPLDPTVDLAESEHSETWCPTGVNVRSGYALKSPLTEPFVP